MKIISLLILIPSISFGLQVSEIFYKGDNFISSDERYLEIFNNDSISYNLSNLTVCVPKNDTEITNLKLSAGKFNLLQKNLITNSFLLQPGQCVVIMTEVYNQNNRLIGFAPGTLLLKPRSQAFSGWSWEGRLHLIKLLYNGTNVFDCGNYFLQPEISAKEGLSYHLNGSYYIEGPMTPGKTGLSYLVSDKIIIHEGESAEMILTGTDNYSEIVQGEIENITTGMKNSFSLNKKEEGIYSGTLQLLAGCLHGDSILIQISNDVRLIRFLESRPLSENYRKILINEIVSDPQTDYSGGSWTGENGSGTISETDEWLELVNLKDELVNLSNSVLYYKTSQSESVKKLSFRYNAASGDKSGILSNFNYLVVSPEGGIGNSAVIQLFDQNPYLGGRLIDEVEYGTHSEFSAAEADSSSRENESLSRIPNGVSADNYKTIFIKTRASFGKNNGGPVGLLYAWNVNGCLSNTVYLVDTNFLSQTVEITADSGLETEKIVLTNLGVYFKGVISMNPDSSNPNDGILSVRNGGKIKLTYKDENPAVETSTEFLWIKDGWKLPEETADFKNTLIYPCPVTAGNETVITFANLPQNTEIEIYDGFKNSLKKLSGNDGGMLTWKTTLKKGIYFVYFHSGKGRLVQKFFVQ